MIVTIAKVADFDQFLKTFSTKGARKRKQHGCTGSHVFRDPDDPNRVWVFFDWQIEGYERFLSDPEIPAIARELALREPPVKADPVAPVRLLTGRRFAPIGDEVRNDGASEQSAFEASRVRPGEGRHQVELPRSDDHVEARPPNSMRC